MILFNILIVDDSKTDREAYKVILQKNKKFKFNIIEKDSIKSTKEYISKNPVDCILLDYVLPDGDGILFLSELKKSETLNDIPVIFLTSKGDERLAVKAIKSGADDYFSKINFNDELLTKTINYTLEKKINNDREFLQKQFTEKIANSIPNPIFYQDIEGNIIECNSAFEKFLQKNKKEIINNKLIAIIHNQFTNDCIKFDKTLIDTKIENTFETFFKRKNNEKQYLMVSKAPSFFNNGKIAGIISIITDITERKKSESHYKKLSMNDELTKIPNRRSFNNYFAEKWKKATKQLTKISIIMIDIDYFKKYNDKYGHQAGDYCLQKTAKALKNALLRPEDFIARYGGEEFVVILPETSVDGALTICKRLQKNIANLKIENASSQINDYLTISIGINFVPNPSLDTKDSALEKADIALYQSKRNGRNTISIYSE